MPRNTPMPPSAKPSVAVMPLETLIYCKLSYSTKTGRGTRGVLVPVCRAIHVRARARAQYTRASTQRGGAPVSICIQLHPSAARG